MYSINDLAEYGSLLRELLEPLEIMHGIDLFLEDIREVLPLRSVDLVDPDRVQVLKHQKITQIWLFLRFFRLI